VARAEIASSERVKIARKGDGLGEKVLFAQFLQNPPSLIVPVYPLNMKTFSLFVLVVLSSGLLFSQTPNPRYDSTLAAKLGADAYGMKSYVLVILTTGSNDSQNKAFRDSCFAGHMANIRHLVEEEKLIIAGPLGKNEKGYRGIFILQVPMEEAEELMQTDPAIHADLLGVELYPWYGSAALPEYLVPSELSV
jgi:uncharacterized protein YciI